MKCSQHIKSLVGFLVWNDTTDKRGSFNIGNTEGKASLNENCEESVKKPSEGRVIQKRTHTIKFEMFCHKNLCQLEN